MVLAELYFSVTSFLQTGSPSSTLSSSRSTGVENIAPRSALKDSSVGVRDSHRGVPRSSDERLEFDEYANDVRQSRENSLLSGRDETLEVFLQEAIEAGVQASLGRGVKTRKF